MPTPIRPGRAPPVTTAGRVPALVEHRGNDSQAGHDEQVGGVTQDLAERGGEPVGGQQPVVHGRDADGDGHDDRRPEEGAKERSRHVGGAAGQQGAAGP